MLTDIRLSVKKLRLLDSKSAADWIIENYPAKHSVGRKAIELIPHLSWKREDQDRLANEYLQNLPYGDSKAYDAFASFMTMERLIRILNKYLPKSKWHWQLFLYYVKPTLLHNAKSDRDRLIAEKFLDECVRCCNKYS